MSAPPPGTPMPPPAPAYYAPPMPPQRPIGVAILAVLTVLGGIGTLGLGLLLVLGGAVAGSVGGFFGALGIFIIVLGAIVALFGVLGILAGIGLWRMRPWAWWLAFIVGILQVLAAFATYPESTVTLALWIVIVVYLLVVKKHFGPRPAGM